MDWLMPSPERKELPKISLTRRVGLRRGMWRELRHEVKVREMVGHAPHLEHWNSHTIT